MATHEIHPAGVENYKIPLANPQEESFVWVTLVKVQANLSSYASGDYFKVYLPANTPIAMIYIKKNDQMYSHLTIGYTYTLQSLINNASVTLDTQLKIFLNGTSIYSTNVANDTDERFYVLKFLDGCVCAPYRNSASSVAVSDADIPSAVSIGSFDLIRNNSDFRNLGEIIQYYIDNPPPPPPTDPYEPAGTSEPGGGTGDLDDTSDPIDFPIAPSVTALDCKFISLYTPTLTQLQSLATYMWGNLFDLNTLKKLFADPMQVILGLSIVPVAVPYGSQPVEVGLGNISSTGVMMNKATGQYVDVDCGTLNVNEYWGAYLDYEPYTKLSIYLPYIGYKPLNIDDCMGTAVQVKYRVDCLTGACVAMIKCGDSILYQHAGACAVSIPITGTDWTNVINGIISSVVSTAGIIAGTVTGAAPVTAAAAMAGVSSAAQNAMNMKPTIDRSGTISTATGYLGCQKPYLVLTRPRQALPQSQNTYSGYPSYMTKNLVDLSGMTYVSLIHLEGIPCTAAELSEIDSLLKAGVIL